MPQVSFSYDTGPTVFAPALPARAWVPRERSIGGRLIATAGVPVSYRVRAEGLVEITLRLWESEWEAFLAFLAYGQTGAAFTWTPDTAAGSPAALSVYLEAPAYGEAVTPGRDGDYPRVLDVALVLRGAGSDLAWQEYFA